MALSRRTLSVVLALLISVSFIVAGYVLSAQRDMWSASATSTEELMREYAKKDTDLDGLPDWKESLYGADPENPNSLDPVRSDREVVEAGDVEPRFRSETTSSKDEITDEDFTVPSPGKGTITDEFAKAFFESYMNSADGTFTSGTADPSLVAGLTGDLNARLKTKLSSTYRAEDVITTSSGGESAYLAVLEAALIKAGVPGVGTDPITLIDRFVTKGDNTAEPELRALVENYRASARMLREARVPSSLSATHISLVQTIERLAGAAETVANFHTDPLGTIGGLATFEPSFRDLYVALASLASSLVPGGAAPGMPGATLLEYVRILSIFKTP